MTGADGLAYLKAVAAGELPPPPSAVTLGFDLLAADRGRVELGLSPQVFQHNPAGLVLGGVCAAVCDAACACAVLSMLPPGTGHTTQHLDTSFVRAVTLRTGPLRCTAEVLHLGRRTALAGARMLDADGRLHVQATATFVLG